MVLRTSDGVTNYNGAGTNTLQAAACSQTRIRKVKSINQIGPIALITRGIKLTGGNAVGLAPVNDPSIRSTLIPRHTY